MTRDRVIRFLSTFDSADEATRFARTQASAWLPEAPNLAAPSRAAE